MPLRSVLAIAAGFLVSAPAAAFVIGTSTCTPPGGGFPAPDAGPYMSLFSSDGLNDPGTLMHYRPGHDLLAIPGSADSAMLFNPHGITGPADVTHFNGTYSLYMHATDHYESFGGIFSIHGAVPDLGISAPSLLLAANVVGANVGACDGLLGVQLLMDVDYFNPSFGDWGSQILLAGVFGGTFARSDGQPFPPGTDFTDLLSLSDWVGGPADYYDIWGLPDAVAVPEAAHTLGLIVLALMTIGLGVRKQRVDQGAARRVF